MPVSPKKYTNVLQTPITDIQSRTLSKLRARNIKIPQFVREAIAEKIQREAEELRVKEDVVKCPF